jgi:acetyl-CoA decarbonylase/synthase complex subunit gamma
MAGWTALASFVAMNFTGASTYTSLSGVYAEMKRAIPVQIVLATVSVALWLSGRLAAS